MVVVLRRKPWREVFTTYLPTILLIMTTYVTTFFKSEFFEAALGANLPTMLMMTTIFMSSLSELTDTAYAKWIDIWLIFSQLVPFTVVILLTLKEALKNEEHSTKINVVRPYKCEANTTDVQESKMLNKGKLFYVMFTGKAFNIFINCSTNKTDNHNFQRG